MPLLLFKAMCLLNLVTGIVRQSRRNISHKGRSTGKINAVSAVSVISMVLWIINASVEYGGMTLTRDLCMNWPPCSDADNGFGELRPSLILACKSQPASNGLHLERSEFMCKSFWRTKLVVWSFAALFSPEGYFFLIVGVGSRRSQLRSSSDLGQMSTNTDTYVRARVCVYALRLPGFRRVLASNREWQAFCWALLPHASSNPATD